MPNTTWSPHRATAFARGLHHIAACDGFDRRERASLQAFIDKIGLDTTPEALAAEPFDYAEAAAALDSTWLRRTFVQACRLIVQMDGKVSPRERDALRAMALALDVDEAAALEDITGPRPDPTAIVEWVDGLAVDFIAWDDTRQSSYFWFFPHPDHPVARDAEIRVCHGQVLVVRDDDEQDFTDVLEPGNHRAGPESLPGLTARRGEWVDDRITATLLYVRTAPSTILRWGTSFPAEMMSRRWGMVPIRAFGRFSVRFEDPQGVSARFARSAVPGDDDVEGRLRRMVAGRFAEALSKLDFPDDDALVAGLNDIDALTDRILPDLKAALLRSGIKLIRFLIENLTAPLEVGLRPTSRRTESLNRIGRSLLGGATGPVPTAAVPLVTRAVPSARRAIEAADPPLDPHGATGAIEPIGGDGAVARTTGGLSPISKPAREGVPRPVPVELPALERTPEPTAATCDGCQAQVPVGARFCMQCGRAQGSACYACGCALPATARFCSQCGARQPD